VCVLHHGQHIHPGSGECDKGKVNVPAWNNGTTQDQVRPYGAKIRKSAGELGFCGWFQAVRRYSLMMPPRTRWRWMGALSGKGRGFPLVSWRHRCATRRLVVSPVQPGGTRREVPGSDGLPGFERMKGTIACQRSSGRAQAYGAMRCGTPRDTAKAGLPVSQSPEDAIHRPSERRLKPALCPAPTWRCGWCNLRGIERSPVRRLKEMNGAPKSCYYVRRGRTWDRLRGASPMVTEAPQ
jgi:hypothetical protein